MAESNFSKIEATLPCWYYADSSTTGVTSADQLLIDDTKYYFPGDLYTTTNSANSMVQANYQFHKKWKSQTVFSNSYNESTGPLTYLSFVSDTSMTRNHQTFEGSTSQFNIQENIIGTFNTWKIKHRFLVGLDYYQNHSNSTYRWYGSMMDTVYTNAPNPHYMNYNKDLYNKSDNSYFFGSYTGIQETRRFGTYFSDVINLTENLLLNVGARYDYYISKGYSDPQQDTTFGPYEQGGFSPKVGLVYQPVKDKIALFGNYQNSFQNVNGGDFYGNLFVPQQANQYEGGIKFNLLKNHMNGMVSYYDITVTNSIRLDQEHPTFSIQDGTQRSSGIEAELNLNNLYGFNLVLGYAYNDNRYIQANEDVIGRRPVEAGAAHLGHAWLSYGISKGKFQGLGFGFGGNYSGEKMINNDTYYGVFYLPSYLVLNSSIFYGAEKFSLGININNLTNERYWVGWNSAVLQKPREVVANLTWKF
ncbi:MAG: TonB-dependent receptor [Crocinitomicaceae bacterium]|nr:TonB-dependent receptor [Crocinitomicaceae bacterium]